MSNQLQSEALTNVADWGAVTIVVLGGLAALLGWFLSGWALRPIREVTESARQVAQNHDLTGRIAYRGSHDELKELADTCDVVLARLSRVFAGQRRFVANAAHELRTPLAVNRTLVDVAIRRSDASDDVRRLGESLLELNMRHEHLVERLLALADSEQKVVVHRSFDLKDVVENVLDHAEKEGAEHGVTLHRLLDAAVTAGDAVLLERLVQNLVENAIRHNEEGGELWVMTSSHGDRVELVVVNTGARVQGYEVETIFEPFHRLGGDRLRSHRGAGLGLSIVQAIADAHDGTVTASPREEGGLMITVALPARPDDRQRVTTTPQEASG